MGYATLTPKVKAVLDSLIPLKKLGAVYARPITKIGSFPAAVFYPVAYEGSYLTTVEDMAGYSYRIYLVAETKVAGMDDAWNSVLTGAVDAVRAAFAAAWDQGTDGGHRIWWKIENGDWYMAESADGLVAVAELNLKINQAVTV